MVPKTRAMGTERKEGGGIGCKAAACVGASGNDVARVLGKVTVQVLVGW